MSDSCAVHRFLSLRKMCTAQDPVKVPALSVRHGGGVSDRPCLAMLPKQALLTNRHRSPVGLNPGYSTESHVDSSKTPSPGSSPPNPTHLHLWGCKLASVVLWHPAQVIPGHSWLENYHHAHHCPHPERAQGSLCQARWPWVLCLGITRITKSNHSSEKKWEPLCGPRQPPQQDLGPVVCFVLPSDDSEKEKKEQRRRLPSNGSAQTSSSFISFGKNSLPVRGWSLKEQTLISHAIQNCKSFTLQRGLFYTGQPRH